VHAYLALRAFADEAMTAVCRVTLKNRKTPIESRFSVEDAKVAGLWNDNKRPVWQKYPKRMLKMRAREAFRDADPGALMGLMFAEVAMDLDPEIPEAQVEEPSPPSDSSLEPAADEVATESPQTDPGSPVTTKEDISTVDKAIEAFINDQTSTVKDYQYITQKFDQFIDDCVIFYKAEKDQVKRTMVEQGLENAWDKFQEWILNQAKKKKKQAKKDPETPPDEPESTGNEKAEDTSKNIWLGIGWKRQGGQKFKKYVLAHLVELYQMPEDFVIDVQKRYATMDLGEFPADPQSGPAMTLSSESDDIKF